MTGNLRQIYKLRRETVLDSLARSIQDLLTEYLTGIPRIDRIQARAKSVDRFVGKAEKIEGGVPKYADPINQIQDQIGARIVGFYLSDISVISSVIEKYFRRIEQRTLIPESEAEFGYFGLHYVLIIPEDVKDPSWSVDLVPEFFELQIKTVFQHAWSEASHDIGYKSGSIELSNDDKRTMAFASAQAWGADRVFDDIFLRNQAQQN